MSRRGLDEIYQCLRSIGLPRPNMAAGGKYGEVLNIRGQWSKVVDTAHRQELADLLESDLRLSTCDHFADGHARRTLLALRLEGMGNPHALKQVGQIDPAGAGRIGDGAGEEQRAPERFAGA